MNAPTQAVQIIQQELTYLETKLPILTNGKVDGRKLHELLGSSQKFTTWMKARIEDYGFTEGEDYAVVNYDDTGSQICEAGISQGFGAGGQHLNPNKIEYHLSIGMAKELGMVERNEIGRQIRKYFIRVEELLHKKLSLEHRAAMNAISSELDQTKDVLEFILEKKADNRADIVRLGKEQGVLQNRVCQNEIDAEIQRRELAHARTALLQIAMASMSFSSVKSLKAQIEDALAMYNEAKAKSEKQVKLRSKHGYYFADEAGVPMV